MASIHAQKSLSSQQGRVEKALAQLASGDRITRAADDAAGLALSENVRSQVRGISVAKQNALDAMSLVQVSEGGLNEVSNILIRLRELGVQAASDSIGDTEREFLNTEASQLIEEVDRIARTTRFGSQLLLDGSGEKMEFQVGPYGGEENIISFQLDANARASELGIDGIDISDKWEARDSLDSVDGALLKLGKLRSDLGAVQSRLEASTNHLDIQFENLSEARSRIKDADVALASSELASANILQQAALSVLAQANAFPQASLRLLS